jgi:L-lactate dehydrogenase (cytochrome)
LAPVFGDENPLDGFGRGYLLLLWIGDGKNAWPGTAPTGRRMIYITDYRACFSHCSVPSRGIAVKKYLRLNDCFNFHDFQELARRRVPGPIFNYIAGGADDEVTLRRNTAAFEQCDLVPSVLRGVANVDTSVTVMGQRLAMPFYCSPTALQRLFHHQGERAVAAAAAKFGTMFGVSSLGTVSLEELRKKYETPQVYQFYFHKDRGLNHAMLQRAKQAGVDVMMLTVDSITGGNRERDLRTGFSIPFRMTLGGMLQFAIKPMWALNYVTHERFKLPQLDQHVDMAGDVMSIGRYFTEMLDPSMNWDDVAEMVRTWNGQFCLKGVMSVADAKRAVEIGCTGIILSNHGGRQLDGSRSAFDQLAEIVDAVGDRIDVMMDGGIQRGSHVLKALSLGAKAVGVGRLYLFALAAAGQAGVERALGLMKAEIERDMRLMGCATIKDLTSSNLRFR